MLCLTCTLCCAWINDNGALCDQFLGPSSGESPVDRVRKIKAQLMSQAIARQREIRMRNEKRLNGNRTVKLWLEDCSNFPDLASFLSVNREEAISLKNPMAVSTNPSFDSSTRVVVDTPRSVATVDSDLACCSSTSAFEPVALCTFKFTITDSDFGCESVHSAFEACSLPAEGAASDPEPQCIIHSMGPCMFLYADHDAVAKSPLDIQTPRRPEVQAPRPFTPATPDNTLRSVAPTVGRTAQLPGQTPETPLESSPVRVSCLPFSHCWLRPTLGAISFGPSRKKASHELKGEGGWTRRSSDDMSRAHTEDTSRDLLELEPAPAAEGAVTVAADEGQGRIQPKKTVPLARSLRHVIGHMPLSRDAFRARKEERARREQGSVTRQSLSSPDYVTASLVSPSEMPAGVRMATRAVV